MAFLLRQLKLSRLRLQLQNLSRADEAFPRHLPCYLLGNRTHIRYLFHKLYRQHKLLYEYTDEDVYFLNHPEKED